MSQLWYAAKNLSDQDKTPVVLLHGFLESSSMWDHIQFPTNFPLIQIDLPGHGQSKHEGQEILSMEDIARDVIAIIDQLEIAQYHIIGHSMGGYVALEMKRLDKRSKRVMLLNSNFWSDSSQKVKDRLRVAEIVQTNKSHFIYEVIPNLFLNPQQYDVHVKSIISEAMDMSSEAIAQTSVAMSKRKDVTGLIRETPSTFTCVQGDQDTIVSVRRMRKLATEMKIEYFELKNVGHMAHIEAPIRLKKIVDSFLMGEE